MTAAKKVTRSPDKLWADRLNTVTIWVGMGTDAIRESALRLCVTTFVCKRLPQGMPVSPEDAKCLAREARMFLKALFKEVEC